MSNFYFFRNCFTGAIAGGDVHSGGVAEWIKKNIEGSQVFLVRPHGDHQETFYPETKNLKNLQYRSLNFSGSFALTFIMRSILATLLIKVPATKSKTILVASSHFLPDVLPVSLKLWRKQNVRRAVYIHHIIQDMDRPDNFNTTLANVQEKLCFYLIKKYFDRIIVVNKQVAEDLINRGFNNQKILLSSNFISQSIQAIPYKKKNIDAIFCGRMVPQKGVYEFLDICQKLQKEQHKFQAVMVGMGPELNKLKKIVKDRKLNVRLTGYIKNNEKFKLLSESKIFVFPSHEEGWGIAIAESLTAGTPVIAYELPVYQEVFNGKIHATPLGNADSLAEQALELLMNYKQNSNIYTKEQKTVQNFSRKFTLNKVAQSQHDFFTEKK